MSDKGGQARDAGMSATDQYLVDVQARLRMPDEASGDVLDELASHIEDAIAEGMRNGLTADEAERIALGRLGAPKELGDELRRTHQTRRRLLAAAGGGAWQAAKGAVRGYFAGIIIGVALTIGGSIVLAVASLVDPVPLSGYRWFELMVYPSIWTAGWLSARELVLGLSRRSLRAIADVRAPVAWVGAAVVAFLVAALPADHTHATVVLSIATPLVFAVGALTADRDVLADILPDRWVDRRRLQRNLFIAFVGLVLVAIVVPTALGLGVGPTVTGPHLGPDGPVASAEERWNAAGYDVVAARVIDFDELPIFRGFEHDGFLVVDVPHDRVDWDEWTRVQFEVWPATDPYLAEGAQQLLGHAPMGIVPVEDPWAAHDVAIRVGYPEAEGFLAFLVAEDRVTGERVAFGRPEGDRSTFHGSLFDWFAPR
jgi:hypothetical protein